MTNFNRILIIAGQVKSCMNRTAKLNRINIQEQNSTVEQGLEKTVVFTKNSLTS